MNIKLILLVSLMVAIGASGSPEEDCISRTALITSTFQDEIDMRLCRHDKDVIATVRHSEGSCELRINDPAFDDKWLRAKLSLKDTIVLSVNGTRFASKGVCTSSLKIKTIKTVSVDEAQHLLPDCSQGPAIYEISKDLEDVLIPWYEGEAQLVLEPKNDTRIRIEVGGQEFVVCFNGTDTAAQRNESACTGGAGTSDITLIIPKSNKVIKVITADGKEAETQVINGAADVPLTVRKTLINGTIIMRQCMPECTIGKNDYSCTVYLFFMVIFLVATVVLAAVVAYLLLRARG